MLTDPSSIRNNLVNEKTLIQGLDPHSYAIHAAASARIYHAQLNAKQCQWSYSRLKGTLFFGNDKDSDTPQNEAERYWFRLIDDASEKTVWMFKVPLGIDYEVDRPFFHVFQGMVRPSSRSLHEKCPNPSLQSRRYGFLFSDDDEATVFAGKVKAQVVTYVIALKGRTRSIRSNSMKIRAASTSPAGTISRCMISSPTPDSFKHVAHVGVNKDGVFESKGLDSTWNDMIAELHIHGMSEAVVSEQKHFVEGFWKGNGRIRASSNRAGVQTFDISSVQTKIAPTRKKPVPKDTL